MAIKSVEDQTGSYCIDFDEDEASGTVTFKLFRREPEDYGRWTLTADFSGTRYADITAAVATAKLVAPWFESPHWNGHHPN